MDSSLARFVEVSNGYRNTISTSNEKQKNQVVWSEAMEDLSCVGKELHDCRLKKLALTEVLYSISQGETPRAELIEDQFDLDDKTDADSLKRMQKLSRRPSTGSMDMPVL